MESSVLDDVELVLETSDSQTQTDPCISVAPLVLAADQGTQVGEFPSRPYHLYESRKRSEIRTELINKIQDLLCGYVHGDNDSLPTLVEDLYHSKKWSSTFGIPEIKETQPCQISYCFPL